MKSEAFFEVNPNRTKSTFLGKVATLSGEEALQCDRWQLGKNENKYVGVETYIIYIIYIYIYNIYNLKYSLHIFYYPITLFFLFLLTVICHTVTRLFLKRLTPSPEKKFLLFSAPTTYEPTT